MALPNQSERRELFQFRAYLPVDFARPAYRQHHFDAYYSDTLFFAITPHSNHAMAHHLNEAAAAKKRVPNVIGINEMTMHDCPRILDLTWPSPRARHRHGSTVLAMRQVIFAQALAFIQSLWLQTHTFRPRINLHSALPFS
jgi:hypothetical protein